MMTELKDDELIACIYMLCSELVKRSDNKVTLQDVLSSVWSIEQLLNPGADQKSEDNE
jgi:hypothetical protein